MFRPHGQTRRPAMAIVTGTLVAAGVLPVRFLRRD
jgi:hypothetical protein